MSNKKYSIIVHMKIDEYNKVSKITFTNVVSHVINSLEILCITCYSGSTAQIPLNNMLYFETIE